MNYKILLILILVVMLGACSTPRNVAYFQGIDELTAKQRELMTQTYNPKIYADDLLTINVSSKDPSVAAPYNPPAYSYYMQGEQQVNAATVQNVYTYLVDKEGYIIFPELGRVHLACRDATRKDSQGYCNSSGSELCWKHNRGHGLAGSIRNL